MWLRAKAPNVGTTSGFSFMARRTCHPHSTLGVNESSLKPRGAVINAVGVTH